VRQSAVLVVGRFDTARVFFAGELRHFGLHAWGLHNPEDLSLFNLDLF
jgi:hypothetical protein